MRIIEVSFLWLRRLKLLVSILEQHTIAPSGDTEAINADIYRRANAVPMNNQLSGSFGSQLATYRFLEASRRLFMGALNEIFNYITELLNAHGGQFAWIGQQMYTGLATIMVVWFGVQAALSAHERAGGFPFAKLAELLLTISFGYAMIT